jgi:hypothetical protein
MQRLVRQALVGAIVLLPAAGGIALVKSGSGESVNVVQAGAPSPFAEIEIRRTALEQRIADGRHANKLNGVGYFTALDQQHKILVKQKRAEAQGLTEAVRRELLADIDRANAGIDRYMAK